jgi:hypothetical protein
MRPELKLKLPASFAAVEKGSPRTLTLLVEVIEDAFTEPNDLEGGVEDEIMDIRNGFEFEKNPTTNPSRSICLARIMMHEGRPYVCCCERFVLGAYLCNDDRLLRVVMVGGDASL